MCDILGGVTFKTHHMEVLGCRSVSPELRQEGWKFQANFSYKSRLFQKHKISSNSRMLPVTYKDAKPQSQPEPGSVAGILCGGGTDVSECD